jgi:hypothetical protein
MVNYHGICYQHSTVITIIISFYNTEWWYYRGMAVNYCSKKFYNIAPRSSWTLSKTAWSQSRLLWHEYLRSSSTNSLGLIRARSHSKTSIFPVPFRIPGHFGDGAGFVEGDTGLVQVRDDHFCPVGRNSGKTQLPGTDVSSSLKILQN